MSFEQSPKKIIILTDQFATFEEGDKEGNIFSPAVIAELQSILPPHIFLVPINRNNFLQITSRELLEFSAIVYDPNRSEIEQMFSFTSIESVIAVTNEKSSLPVIKVSKEQGSEKNLLQEIATKIINSVRKKQ